MGYNVSYKEEQDALWEAIDEIGQEICVIRTLPEEVSLIELKAIHTALHNHNGNRTKAAEELGIGRTNLIAKIKKYKLALKELAD
jgi:transcriptional regulator with PAS, ATPase and Fis domain